MSRFRNPAGVDLDLIFAARASVTAGATNLRNADSLDLNQRYEGLGTQSPSASTTNLRNPAGVDLRLIFATSSGVPQNFAIAAYQQADTGTPVANIALLSNGEVTASSASNQRWFSVPRAGVGNDYDVIFTNRSATGGASWVGTFDTWLQLDVTRSVGLSRSTNGDSTATLTATIRRRSDGVQVATGNLTLTVSRGAPV